MGWGQRLLFSERGEKKPRDWGLSKTCHFGELAWGLAGKYGIES